MQLATGERVRVDVTLAVGAFTEATTVTADAPLLQTESSSLGEVIGNRSVVQLPLNGRSYLPLVALVPGVALPPGSAFPRLNGGRPRVNEYLYDGISVLQPEPGTGPVLPDHRRDPGVQGRHQHPSGRVRALQRRRHQPQHQGGEQPAPRLRVRVPPQRGPERAEPLRARPRRPTPTSRTSAATSSASSWAGRSRRTGPSSSWTTRGAGRASAACASPPSPPPSSDEGIFTEPVAGQVPTIYDPATTRPAAGGGTTRDPFPANTIPADRIDPVAAELLARYPLPNLPGTANNYRRVANEGDDQDQFDVRVDHRASSQRPVVRPLQLLQGPDRPGHAAARRQRQPHHRCDRAHRHAVAGGRPELRPLVRAAHGQRPAPGLHAPLGGPHGPAPGRHALRGPRPARDPDERRLRERAAHLHHRRLPAARVVRQHELRLRRPT